MNRIDAVIAVNKKQGTTILSPYITAGDPLLSITVPLMHALADAGADILELGIPFSDPMAEGPVIQAAMERALAQGIQVDTIIDMVATFRKKNTHTPIILMGYLNSLENYGYEKFAIKAKAAGVDGTIMVDMPPEESVMLTEIWKAHNLYSIYLCSPTTTEKRMAKINQVAAGYLYYVSLKGVTGSNALDINQLKTAYEQRKAQTTLPLMVGFGIKTPDMAAQVGSFSDGVIVGAALIETIYAEFQKYQNETNSIAAGVALIAAMRQAMNNGSTQL